MKAVALLRIAAHTCGRSRVELADALLLEHVFAATPQEAELIRNFVISWIASRSRAPTQFSALLEGLALRARSEKSTRTGMADEAAAIQQARARRGTPLMPSRALALPGNSGGAECPNVFSSFHAPVAER